MRKVIDYKRLRDIQDVQEYLLEDWELYGSPTATGNSVYQAIVKYEPVQLFNADTLQRVREITGVSLSDCGAVLRALEELNTET